MSDPSNGAGPPQSPPPGTVPPPGLEPQPGADPQLDLVPPPGGEPPFIPSPGADPLELTAPDAGPPPFAPPHTGAPPLPRPDTGLALPPYGAAVPPPRSEPGAPSPPSGFAPPGPPSGFTPPGPAAPFPPPAAPGPPHPVHRPPYGHDAPPAHVATGHAAQGHAAQGHAPPGYVQPGYGPPGYGPPAHGPSAYGPAAYGPQGYPPPYGAAPVQFSRGAHRLHPVTAVLNAVGVVVILFVLGGYSVLLTQTPTGVALLVTPAVIIRFVVVMMPICLVATAAGLWIWWSLKFWISGDDLVVETGILRRRARRIPLAHMQAVDVVRPLVSRVLGLAEVRVELAGGDQAETTLRYLGRRTAERLRAELLARAAGLPGHTPEAPERGYWRVGFGTLLASQFLKLPVIGALTLLAALLAFGIVFGELGVLAAALPVLLGLARGVIAPLVMHGGFRAALSPDGLRLRYGLIETRMQTVPPGRVQAVRLVEPVLWRAYGWARIDVTVAGYVGDRQALSSVLLPVAPRHVAVQMIGLVFPGTNPEAVRLLPAPRSWLRAPFARGEAGTDDALFVSRRGRVCRRTDVIAHARSQSVRLSAGPLQRFLRLGTVHIDAPPGPVQVAAENRELGEARAIVESAAERAHRARATDVRTERWAT